MIQIVKTDGIFLKGKIREVMVYLRELEKKYKTVSEFIDSYKINQG